MKSDSCSGQISAVIPAPETFSVIFQHVTDMINRMARETSGYKDLWTGIVRFQRIRLLSILCPSAWLLLTSLFFLSCARGAIEFRPQPNYSNLFRKDQIQQTPSRSIARLKQQKDDIIPRIYWPAKQHWVDLYNGTWNILLENLRDPTLVTDNHGTTRKALPFSYIDEGYSNTSIYQWDSIFAVHTARYIGRHFYLSGSLDNFYAAQHTSGFISRELSESNGDDIFFMEDPDYPWLCSMLDRRLHGLGIHQDWMKEFFDNYIQSNKSPIENSDNPPLFAWAELEYSRFQFNPVRLAMVANVIERHLEWLESHKTRTLSIHRHAYKGEHVHLFHQTPLGSGMDNIPLFGDGWVDMSSQMYLAYDRLSEIYRLLARKTQDDRQRSEFSRKAVRYRYKASELKAAINECLWSESAGFYFNVSGHCRHKITRYSLAGIWPMFAGLASREQAEKLVETLFNPDFFYTEVPFPVLARNDEEFIGSGGYWRGGVWAPTNYMVIRGLMNYGYFAKARDATSRYLDALANSFQASGTLYEYYSVHGERGYNPLNRSANTADHYARDHFVGWTGLGPISLMIELMVGVRFQGHPNLPSYPARPDKKDEAQEDGIIYWDLAGNDEVAIENLNINGKHLSLRKKRRHKDDDTAYVHITAKGRSPGTARQLIIIHNQNNLTLSLERDINDELFEIPAYR